MSNYSKNIVYLSKQQYQELITNNSITVNDVTINYNDDDLYVTPQTEPVTDVQLVGTSITVDGIVNIPKATSSTLGVVAPNATWGITQFDQSGKIGINKAADNEIKAGLNSYKPIVPTTQHKAAFYGLAYASGDTTQSESSNSIGNYTDTAKQKIQNMLGITDLISTEESSTATAVHTLNSTFMMNGKLHRATAAIAIGDAVEVGTNCEIVKADEVFVKNTDIARGIPGIVTVETGTGAYGVSFYASNSSVLTTVAATSSNLKAGTNAYKPVVSSNLSDATYYGLSKLAGVDLANETVTVGTYPETSKTAIRSLIGAAAASDIPSVPVQDVQVNGTSIVSGGVANIPVSSANDYGVVKTNVDYGVYTRPDGILQIRYASSSEMKNPAGTIRPILAYYQHESVFYGLAKVSGDTTQASSSNAVGNYTDAAKSAIQTMLGVQSGVSFVETVSGSTPSISGVANTRYICGEVSTISITPPNIGTIDVQFTSGTTPAVLTLPNTVKFPSWVDLTTLEASTVYEIMITDGVYGGVMIWAD